MPLTYTIHPEQRLLYVVGQGKVGLADLLANLEQVAADGDYRPPMCKLVDYRHSEVLALTAEECRIFTEKKRNLAERFAGETCAIVTPQDIDFGMARMHGLKMEGTAIETNTFRRLEPALEWLGVEVTLEQLGARP